MSKAPSLCFWNLVLFLTIASCNKRVDGEFQNRSGLTDVSNDLGNGNLDTSAFDGGWGSEFTDSTKANHFVYSFKLCNNPIPSNGGANCVAESGYTIVENTSPLRAEKKLNTCIVGYNLINGACVAPTNGAWSLVFIDNSKTDHFVYNYKLCNNPTPANGGASCTADDNYSIIIGTSPLREEQKTNSCVAGYTLSNGVCAEIVNGGWRSDPTFIDLTKADHFKYTYKLCNQPSPQNGGANCSVEAGYTLVANSSPLKEEIKTNSCISGYLLVGNSCSLIENGAWGNIQADNTKSDHFEYEYKLCNSPTPSNGGSPCTVDSGYILVANSSPLRQERKLTSCIAGYINVEGTCVQDFMNGRTSITTVVGGGTCKPTLTMNGACSAWTYWGVAEGSGVCPSGTAGYATGLVNAGTDGFICIKTAHLTPSGWDSVLNIPVGGLNCQPIHDSGTSCGGPESHTWQGYGAVTDTNQLVCPAGTFGIVTAQVAGGPTGVLCLTNSSQVNGQWTISNEFKNSSRLKNIVGGKYCQPVYDGVYYGGGGCADWTPWGNQTYTSTGTTGVIWGGPNGVLFFE